MGISDFQQLQNQLKRGDDATLAYYLFDIPYFDGYCLPTRRSWSERVCSSGCSRRNPATTRSTLRYSEHIEGGRDEVLTQACKSGLEGIVSKRADSAYVQARSPAWLKIKCTKRQEFVIGGYTKPAGRGRFWRPAAGILRWRRAACICRQGGHGVYSAVAAGVYRELKKRTVR